MPKHDFGIISEISKKRYDDYEPQKYGCISVNDDFIEPILEKLSNLDTFSHALKVPYKGLVYYGITLIPPSSLKDFQSILIDNRNDDNDFEFEKLIQLFDKAILKDKYVIHFGI